MDLIYLDSNATSQPAPEVVRAMTDMLQNVWGNPSSIHRFGQVVRQRLELARASVAKLVGCKDRELVFTSGGTEANNMALRGVLADRGQTGGDKGRDTGRPGQSAVKRVLLTTKIEHSAIREPAALLSEGGVQVVFMPITIDGWLSPDVLKSALEEHVNPGDTAVVSVQWANNETGVIQPVAELGKVVAEHRARLKTGEAASGLRGRLLFHCDATQAVGKERIDVTAAGLDLMTFAAHKFHGPKGVGALFIRSGVRVHPQNLGGPQERDRRGGTENTAGIVGMAVAAELAKAFIDNDAAVERQRALRDRFEGTMLRELPDTVVNSGGAPRLWNTSNLGFPRLEAEAILIGLSERGELDFGRHKFRDGGSERRRRYQPLSGTRAVRRNAKRQPVTARGHGAGVRPVGHDRSRS